MPRRLALSGPVHSGGGRWPGSRRGRVLAVGKYCPGSGLEPFGLQSAREIVEHREALEAEDLDQMVAAHNARRRARGEPEVTADEVEARVLRERSEQRRRREA